MRKIIMSLKQAWVYDPDLYENLTAEGYDDDVDIIVYEDGYVYLEDDSTDPVSNWESWDKEWFDELWEEAEEEGYEKIED